MLRPRAREPEREPRTAECLVALRALAHADAPARTRLLRTLGRLQRAERGLRVAPAAVAPHLRTEARQLALLVGARRAFETARARGWARRLLVRALVEKSDEALERIMRLIGLGYSRVDVGAAQRALRHGQERARAGALELLDNLLEADVKGPLMKALDAWALDAHDLGQPDGAEALAALLSIEDPWLRACAALMARASGLHARRLGELGARDPDLRVREATRVPVPVEIEEPMELRC
jgi:hypothetical protein